MLLTGAALAVIFAAAAFAAGCGSSESSKQEDGVDCSKEFAANTPDYTACLFVNAVQAEAAKGFKGNALGAEVVKNTELFIDDNTYDLYFNSNHKTYPALLTELKGDIGMGIYTHAGAHFQSLDIVSEQDAMMGAIRPIPNKKIDVHLSNGSGFPIQTIVQINDHWYILTLAHAF